MIRKDDFDLDLQTVKNEGGKQEIGTSFALCTPGTCHDDCKPTAWFCSNACITKTCLTCV